MAHLRDGVPNGVINRSFSDLAAGDMGNGNSEWQSGGHGCQSLETISENKKYVRSMMRIDLRKPNYTETNRLRNGFRRIGCHKHLDSFSDLEISLDITYSQTKIRRKM